MRAKRKITNMIKNDEGFTLIEIIAVLVILGILAAVAIPKYLDMRTDAVIKAAGSAKMELNARERLTLAKWKLQDGMGKYDSNIVKDGSGTIADYNTKLGADWNDGNPIWDGDKVIFQNKDVYFQRCPQANENVPAEWYVKVDSAPGVTCPTE